MKKTSPTQHKKDHPAPQPLPKSKIEQDADELVHRPEDVKAKEAEEGDPDDLVHRTKKPNPESLNQTGLEDPDDLVHRSA